MRTIKSVLCALIAVCLLSACGGSKNATLGSTSKKTKIELDECQQYAMAKPDIRAWGEGVSFNLSKASNLAELQARAKMARAIESKVKDAMQNSGLTYTKASTNGVQGAMASDEGAKQNEEQTSIANQVIKSTAVVKTSQYAQQDGTYQVFVCVEYREGVSKMAEEITNLVQQQVSDEERLKMNFEFEKFRKQIEEELKKSSGNE